MLEGQSSEGVEQSEGSGGSARFRGRADRPNSVSCNSPCNKRLNLASQQTQARTVATHDATSPTHLMMPMLASFFGALAAQAPTTSTPLTCATPIDFALVLDESYSMNRWKNDPPGPNYMDGPDGAKALAKELVRHAAI